MRVGCVENEAVMCRGEGIRMEINDASGHLPNSGQVTGRGHMITIITISRRSYHVITLSALR